MIPARKENSENNKVFKVPEHYFDTLTERILELTANAPAENNGPSVDMPKRQITLKQRMHRRLRLTAAAAAVAGFVITVGVHTMQHGEQRTDNTPYTNTMAEANDDNTIDTMIDYVMYDDADLYAYMMDE